MATRRRALVILATLIIMMSALLIAMSLVFRSQADLAGLRVSLDGAQSRALLRSGVAALLVELDRQRDALLDSELPELEAQYTIYETGERLGVIRLLPLDDSGRLMIDEASRMDINHVDDAAALAATGLVDEAAARRIIAYRGHTFGGVFESVMDLLHVPRITDAEVLGNVEDLMAVDDTDRLIAGSTPRGLADVLTVHAVEPALQRNGVLRINLNVPWSDELADRVRERWDDDAVGVLQQIFENGTTFESDADIVRVLRFFNVEPESWPEILDALTTDPREYHFGRVNINTADAAALAMLPGVDETIAAAMVQQREGLDMEMRNTVVWPLLLGVVTEEQMEQMVGAVTTRSWAFRVRIAAGEVSVDEPDGALARPLVADVVVDLASPRARIAAWRDVSALEITAALAAAREVAAVDPDGQDVEDERVEGSDVGPARRGPAVMRRPPTRADASAPVEGDAEEDAAAAELRGRRIGRWLSGEE